MKSDGPPDDWGENDPIVPSEERVNTSGDRLASELRTTWILAVRNHVQRQTGEPCTYNSKPMWDGGLCPITRRKYQPVWPKLVREATQKGLDPLRLVTVLFASIGTGPSPKPHDITCATNVARYHTYVRTAGKRAESALRTEEAVYRSAVWSVGQTVPDPLAAIRFVLNDLGRSLSPLFRYSVATMKGMTDIADRWRTLATDQVGTAPEGYLNAWAPLIPQDITAVAKAAVGRVA